jgi:Cu2+-exporting ATPase
MDTSPQTSNPAAAEHEHEESEQSVTEMSHGHEHHDMSADAPHHHDDAQHDQQGKTAAKSMDHSAHDPRGGHDAHAGHGVMHEGHATMMRNRFFVCLPLTIIVVLYSPMVQNWLGFTMPTFPGSELIAPILGSVIFFYGGLPFLDMARQELALRQPGMMTLISLAITTAYLYSVGVFLFPPQEAMGTPMDFFWELGTLITVMLLGHWIELRSVGQAQGALRELAKLLPDTAERILPSGETETVEISQLKVSDRVLIRPGASVPADGVVVEGESSVNESMITGESKPVEKGAGAQVIGGTVNGSGSLRVEISQIGDNTALAGIMRLVEEAQKSQSRAQTLA